MEQPAPQDIKHHFAGIFLITESGKVVGQQRDSKPNIDNPGKISAFGGTVEQGEPPALAVWRELVQEETNLIVDPKDIIHLSDDVAWRELTSEWEVRHFYYAYILDDQIENMEVYEGQGWTYITGPEDPLIIENWRPVVRQLFAELSL